MNNNKKNQNQNNKLNKKPIVSVCTITFNRRPFIPFMIQCFLNQTYPLENVEWIIIDDGTDPIYDLVKDIPYVKYFYSKDKMLLGKKRNYMHSKCSGDFIIYMDDDDYYPPERISHAVETLINNPTYLIAGSSEMHIYFSNMKQLYKCGPYAINHATAATFAFRKELLLQTKYNDASVFSEEKQFLKGYTIPLIQLDTLKTILVFSHKHNSLNKEKLLENPKECLCTPSKYSISNFMKDEKLIYFYTIEMNTLLENYEPGRPENKPQIMKEIKKWEEERQKRVEDHRNFLESQKKVYQHNNNDIEEIKISYEKQLEEKNYLINELLKKVKSLTNELNAYKLENSK